MKQALETYLNALNNHKIDQALQYLSNDFQLQFTNYEMSIDKQQMVDVLGWDVGTNGSVTYDNITAEGNSLRGVFTEQNDFLKLLDIEKLQAENTFVFDESGLIKQQLYKPLPDQPSYQEKLQPVIKWAEENRPEELSEIYPHHKMVFNERMGRWWVTLLKKWKSSQ